MKKKINTQDLVEKIARLARERMTAGPVVELKNLKAAAIRRPPTLLVIEDDQTVRKALQRMLESAGYQILAAGDGSELSAVLSDKPIDLVLLDVGLPWINGYELAEMMKAHVDLKTVPIVFISAFGDQAAIKKGFEVGAHDYLTKPFEVEKVLKTVATLLRLHDAN